MLAEYLAGRQLLLVLDNCEHLVDAAAKLGRPVAAGGCRAAVLATSRESLTMTVDSHQHLVGYHRDCERQARQALAKTAFRAAYHRGLDLAADDAVAYALQQPREKSLAPVVSDEAPLTARELQVAGLIAAGRSNKQIAAELAISQRTAETT